MGIRAVATIRGNRKDLPKLKEECLMEHGEEKANISACSRLSFLQWKDKRCFNVISNYISPNEVIYKQIRQKGEAVRKTVTIPLAIQMYNCHMGGVDISNQLKTYYEVDHKSRYKYYLRLFLTR